MSRWMTRNRVSLLMSLALLAGITLIMSACSTVKGVGQDLENASDSVRTSVFGDDPDAPPTD